MAIKIDNIKATNIELTPAIYDYIDKKMEMLEKFVDENDTSVSASIEVGKTTNHHQNGDVFRAEINFSIGGKQFRAVSETEDLYAAIDEMKDDLAHSLLSDKEKQQTLMRKGASQLKNLIKGFRK
ncbi:ribosome hibernation-promoting factor, HPF/YfiA family [Patescibacteria group bacterium]